MKQIRAEIAKNNDIDYVIEECPHQGNCKGTCPKCEQEVRDLERQLEERRKNGLKVAVLGVAASIPLAVMTGCVPEPQLGGDVAEPTSAYVSTVTTEPAETTDPTETTDDETSIETMGELVPVVETTEEPLAGEPVPYEILGDISVAPEK